MVFHGFVYPFRPLLPTLEPKAKLKVYGNCLNSKRNNWIYDSKELLLNTTSKFEKKEASAVWSNNTCLVRLAEAVSYSVWETADD
jgi:hypothetical protein